MWLCRCAELKADREMLASVLQDESARSSALELLVPTAERLLSAGVVVSVADWMDLTELERVALSIAGRRFQISRAMLEGQAAAGPGPAAAIFAELDGGDAHDGLVLDSAMANAIKHFGGF